MKLLIISDMAHYYRNGQIVAHGPTAREISYLSSLFTCVHHIAFLHADEATAMMLPYQSDKVKLIPVVPSGGESVRSKFGILRLAPSYIKTILSELATADVVHIRCPASISLLAVILLAFVRHPRKRWIKYAGNWKPQGREALAYTLQRWWLNAGLSRGQVTVNGQWPHQPPYVHSFLNPCLTDEELQDASRLTKYRQLLQPVRLIFVGQLNTAKGVGRLLEIAAELTRRGIAIQLDLIGDSPERANFEQQAHALGLDQLASFHGWLPRPALNAHYADAHLMVFPTTSSEGWPKVLSEGMAYGVVPLSGNVSSIPQYLQRFGTGRALNPHDISGFADAVATYVQHPEVWQQESAKGMEASHLFSYANYLHAVRQLLGLSTPDQPGGST